MKILLLGYSKISKKRIIPFFKKNKIKFSVASLSYKKKISGAYKQFNSYEEGIKNSNADAVYISLPNSMHYNWAFKALSKGYNVIVDKPICKNIKQLKKLINLSIKKKKLLSEAIYFNYHKQIKKLLQIVINKSIYLINSNFIIPYPKSGILISKKFDGGVVMDMGPYISAIPRIFKLKKIKSKEIIINKNEKNLIISVNFVISYNSIIYTGSFMFGDFYKNDLEIFTKEKTYKLERVFSPPDNSKLSLTIKQKSKIKNILIKKDNCFKNYFNEVIDNINKGSFNYYHKQILEDCTFRNKYLNKTNIVK